MAQMIIRNLPDEVYEALKARAVAASTGGRPSAEAEARKILMDALAPPLGLGSQLAAIGKQLAELELTNEEIDQTFKRSIETNEPASFE